VSASVSSHFIIGINICSDCYKVFLLVLEPGVVLSL